MPRRTIRVDVPTSNPDDLVALDENILAQHDRLEAAKAGSSPLKAADVAQLRSVVTQAKPARKAAKEHEQQAQVLYEQAARQLGLCKDQNTLTPGTALTLTTKFRDQILADNRGTENALEAWGFTVVVGTAATPKKKAPAA